MSERGRSFLTTFRPLCRTVAGREAATRFGLPPFVDGSCRREPDLQARQPTITALCRGQKFAPRLQVGDRVAYLTKRGRYGGGEDHWRLVALLLVAARLETHEQAAEWHRQRGVALPRNLIVPGNPPAPWEQTDGEISAELRARSVGMKPEQVVRLWDAGYLGRARQHGVVLVCDVIHLELVTPPAIHHVDWMNWLGRVPGTQTPPQIPGTLWARLEQHAAGRRRE